jgi:dephospho-CoA kinase
LHQRKAYQSINKIVHPVVIKAHQRAKREKVSLILLLLNQHCLFESGFNKELHYVITVYANEKNRINRLMIRDEASKSSIKHLMKFQIDEKKKMEMSDFVIMNNKTLEELKVQADFLSRVIKALAK